jgi:Sugar-transfer associated ATP-grasp
LPGSGSGGRQGPLSYFLARLQRLDLRNMVRIAGKISAEYKTPRVFILIDMAVNSVVNNAGYYDYHEWDFNLMNWKQRKTFLTRPQANQLTQKLNDFSFKNNFSDKVAFNKKFAKYIGREWLDVRESSAAQLEAFVTKHGSVMLKDPVNLGGYGLEKKDAASVDDFEAFRQHLLGSGQVLVEEFVTQSVNTLRVITYFDGAEVHVLAHAFKMGAGADLDNFGQGGIQTTVYEGGVCLYGAFNKEGDKYLSHPQTGVSIVGFTVPLYEEAIAMAVEMATVIPEVPYIGWDIAITPTKPIAIEGNYNTGVFQMKPSLSGIKTGLRPLYKRAIGSNWP